jgi:hypothetical protein
VFLYVLITEGRQFKSALRNQLEMRKAGNQESGLFFGASYENWVIVFLASPANVGRILEPDGASAADLQLLLILLIHKGLRAACKIPISYLGKKSVFLVFSRR